MQLIKIKIFGDVQGVNFRRETQAEALELGLKGYVKNEPDGSVYIEAEGEDEDLEALRRWSTIGPEGAKIFKIEVETSDDIMGYTDFAIK